MASFDVLSSQLELSKRLDDIYSRVSETRSELYTLTRSYHVLANRHKAFLVNCDDKLKDDGKVQFMHGMNEEELRLLNVTYTSRKQNTQVIEEIQEQLTILCERLEVPLETYFEEKEEFHRKLFLLRKELREELTKSLIEWFQKERLNKIKSRLSDISSEHQKQTRNLMTSCKEQTDLLRSSNESITRLLDVTDGLILQKKRLPTKSFLEMASLKAHLGELKMKIQKTGNQQINNK